MCVCVCTCICKRACVHDHVCLLCPYYHYSNLGRLENSCFVRHNPVLQILLLRWRLPHLPGGRQWVSRRVGREWERLLWRARDHQHVQLVQSNHKPRHVAWRSPVHPDGYYCYFQHQVRWGVEGVQSQQYASLSIWICSDDCAVLCALGSVHPLQDVALHQCLPLPPVCCFPVPGGSLLPWYVVLPSSAWSSAWSLPSPWLNCHCAQRLVHLLSFVLQRSTYCSSYRWLHAAKLRLKMQIKHAISAIHSILKPGQPVPMTPGAWQVATGRPVFKSLVWKIPTETALPLRQRGGCDDRLDYRGDYYQCTVW